MTGLPTLTIDQPYPALILAGAKRLETRPWPPAGDMCPPGVRAYPGLRINRCDRIGLHAAAARVPRAMLKLGIGDYAVEQDNPRGTDPAYLLRGPRLAWPYRLPLGAVVGTARVVGCVPIHGSGEYPDRPGDYIEDHVSTSISGKTSRLWLCRHRVDGGIDDLDCIEEQRPYGVWRPGWWAWLLDDIQRATQRCPRCEGHGVGPDQTWDDPPTDGIICCLACDGSGHCPPIPAKGKQGLWRWTP